MLPLYLSLPALLSHVQPTPLLFHCTLSLFHLYTSSPFHVPSISSSSSTQSPHVQTIPLPFHPTLPLFNLHMSSPFRLHVHPLPMSRVSFRPGYLRRIDLQATLFSILIIIHHNSTDVLCSRTTARLIVRCKLYIGERRGHPLPNPGAPLRTNSG